MNWFEQLLPPALVRALGWTLVHSLWQGAVVALALAGLLLLLRQHSAEVRYRTAALGLMVLLLLASVTFVRYYTAAPAVNPEVAGYLLGDAAALYADGLEPAAAGYNSTDATPLVLDGPAAVASEAAAPAGAQAWLTYFDRNLPVLVAVWLLGLLAMTLRLLGGLAYVQRLRRYRVQPLAEEWQERLTALAAKAGLKQSVELLESALVRAPVVVGHLRPVILLPLGTVTGLSTTYLEAILAHELAHVQRRDYLMNLLQSVAETLFFYHPAVWFITACLRTERENCCDDVATALVGGNPLTVARALAALAELSVAPEPVNQFAMSALGPDGSVLGRIRRLVQGRTAPTFTEGFMAACVVLGGLVLLTSAVAMADPRPASENDAEANSLAHLPFLETDADTTRKKETTTTTETTNVTTTAPVTVENVETQVLTAPAQPNRASSNLTLASGQDDDKDKKRRKRNQQVVVVQEPRRGRPGTIVIEKDKKGRVTNLTVDGQQVDTGAADKKKSRKTAQQVQVIQVPANRGAWAGTGNNDFNFRFNDDFTRSFRLNGSALSDADVARIRQQAQRAADQARRQLRDNPQWQLEMNRNVTGWADKGARIRLQALQGAERSLEHTLEDEDLNDDARQQIRQQLAELRKQQEEARQDVREQQEEAAQELRNGGDERELEAANRRLEAEMRRHEAEMRRLDAEMRRHDADMRRHDADMRRVEADGRRRQADATEDALRQQLRKDGLIKDTENFQFSLSPTTLTVNGKKQSVAVRDKYLKLVEKQTGRKLTGKNTFALNRQTSGRTSGSGRITAPRAPLAPLPAMPAPPAPPAPPAFSAPAPPAPPRPPRINSDQIRTELRKDGLLGADEKNFQFQLNNSGLTVNGKKQSEEMATKYRNMLEGPDSTGKNTNRNIQISVSE